MLHFLQHSEHCVGFLPLTQRSLPWGNAIKCSSVLALGVCCHFVPAIDDGWSDHKESPAGKFSSTGSLSVGKHGHLGQAVAMKAILVRAGTRQPGKLNCDLFMTQVGEDADFLSSSLPPSAPFFFFFFFYFPLAGRETRHIILAAASQQTTHTLPSSNRSC